MATAVKPRKKEEGDAPAAASRPCYIEVDVNNPRSHTASYYAAAASEGGGGAGGSVLLRDDARHGAVWQAVLAPRALYDRTMHAMASTFLPVGYPHSVREEYLAYQAWDTVQALCSYLRGILTTKAILEGVGVGSEKASALSAAVNWVFRDGVGMACSLVFSSLAATSFDGNVKEWRLFADVINDVGLTLDMLTSVFRGRFLLLTCLSTVCKTMCGVAAGCTKSSITAHFAKQGNIADVAAKENAQETAVTLLGIVGGLLFAHSIADPGAAWPVFVFLTWLHVFANYMGVAALRLYSLNTQRAALVVQDFIDKSGAAASNTRAYDAVPLLTPAEAARRERVWQPFLSWLRGDQPLMGARLSDLGPFTTAADVDFLLRTVYSHERYLLTVHPATGRALVVFRKGAGPRDELKAFFQAQALKHLSPDLPFLVQRERARLLDLDQGSQQQQQQQPQSQRRWPTPAVTKALLGAYEMTVHRFPTFLRCLELPNDSNPDAAAGDADGADDADTGGGDARLDGGRHRRRKSLGGGGVNDGEAGRGEEEEGWDLSRVNFGTSGWRLLAAAAAEEAAGAKGKKDK